MPISSDIHQQFSILQRRIHEHALTYLDNAATTQKPERVIDAISNYYRTHNANVHRGVHTLSDESTVLYEQARHHIATFFGATSEQLIITRNSTEAMNLLVEMWAKFLRPGDVIAVTMQEHHSTLVPWQMVAQRTGCEFLVVPMAESSAWPLPAFTELLQAKKDRLRVVATAAVSNVTGVVAPLEKINAQLREWGVRQNVLFAVDAAQSAAHLPSRLDRWPVDALTFSGHKMYGPMGVGGLVVSERVAKEIAPVLYGGGMIDQVREQETSFHEDFSERFTAGTPDVASLVGLQAAIEFLEEIGWSELQAHEHNLVRYAYEALGQLPQIQLIGPVVTEELDSRVGSVAWTYDGVHAHDVAQILDRSGVAVRSGHHCTMPLHAAEEWVATTRASFAVYNTRADVDRLVTALSQVQNVFGV